MKNEECRVQNEEFPDPSRDRLLWRALVSLSVGAGVFLIAYLAAWLQFRNSPYVAYKRMTSLGALYSVRNAIESYRKDSGRLPSSMTELLVAQGKGLRRNDRGEVCDGWQNPIEYILEGDGYRVRSLGRDGHPGGMGLDADFETEPGQQFSRGWIATRPTLRQFAFDLPEARGIFWGCTAAAVLALGMYAVGSRHRSDQAFTTRQTLINVFGTVFFSLFIGAILVFFLAPWGH